MTLSSGVNIHMSDYHLDGHWVIPSNIDTSKFDFSWRPSLGELPFIHTFGTQHQKTGGPSFVAIGATQVKYHEQPRAVAMVDPESTRWRNTKYMKFDYSWHPDSTEPPFIYQFKTQIDYVLGPRYVVRGATQIKYMDEPRAEFLQEMARWKILTTIDEDSFDFTWTPSKNDKPYIHVFGNNLYSAEEMPTVEYHAPGATERKYHNDVKATVRMPTLDIVFVSNGETGAEERYERLCMISKRPVKRVNGVNGRENALRRAAEISDTEWFFCFPGKLSVNEHFNFNWHPPLKHDKKHYIFYATNPVNGLVYGHQAMVCYNKQLVLETVDYGLDFTMSKPHDVIKVNSGIAEYNLHPLMAWRTAFREAVKLKQAADNGDTESAERLTVWLQPGIGKNEDVSRDGARAGVDFYEEVDGDYNQLMASFDWKWLEQRYKNSDIRS